MGNGMDYSPGQGHGTSSSSASSRRVLRTYDAPSSPRASSSAAGLSAAQRLAQNLRNGRPGVDAVFRSVANGAGRGGPGGDSPHPRDRDEELSVMA